MKDDHWAVGMVHELCPICLNKMNESIILPNELSNANKQRIEEANGKAIGISKQPCEECSKHLSEGFKALIGMLPEKSGNSFEEIYRTGSLIWLKESVLDDVIPNWKEFSITGDFVFTEQSILEDIEKMREP